MSTTAHRMADAMDLRNYTGARLAREARIDQSLISRYLSGQVEPNRRTLNRIGRTLGVSTEWLAGETSDRRRDAAGD